MTASQESARVALQHFPKKVTKNTNSWLTYLKMTSTQRENTNTQLVKKIQRKYRQGSCTPQTERGSWIRDEQVCFFTFGSALSIRNHRMEAQALDIWLLLEMITTGNVDV